MTSASRPMMTHLRTLNPVQLSTLQLFPRILLKTLGRSHLDVAISISLSDALLFCITLLLRQLGCQIYHPHTPQFATASAVASAIAEEYHIGRDAMDMIYMSPDPYHASFDKLLDLRQFDHTRHPTAGLSFFEQD